MACASHILLKTEQDARNIKKKLDNGDDFSQLAKKYSSCPSSKKGGDLGEFRKGVMVAPFDKAVFTNGSEVNRYIGPIKTKFGFHLIQVLYKT
jgi:peptidyl-prolyl cis-trans isomerase C